MLRWLGEAVAEKVAEASKKAIDETTEAAAEKANQASLDLPPHTASGYRWFGVTRREVDTVVNEEARQIGAEVKGRFGDTAGRGSYGLMLERLSGGYLRPAADEEFPELAKRIRKHLRG
jgi:hypothetical protein